MITRAQIVSKLQLHQQDLKSLGVRNIGLFGSYLREEQSEKSDIDLLIDFEPDKENFDNYMSVYDLIETIFGGEKIELVTKNGLSKYIGPNILNNVMYV
jgi:predicted nucleotidyltransferase